jgi:hypothetical protein
MANPDDKEIQKTIEEMNKRVADFHAEKMYSPESSFSSPNLKLTLTIVGVIIVLVLSAVFYIKSTGRTLEKPPASVLEEVARIRQMRQNK